MHGCEDGGRSTSSEVIFDPGEFITRITGRSTTSWIRRLTFVTTTRMLHCSSSYGQSSCCVLNIVLTLVGTCGPFGVAEGERFEWSGSTPGMRFHSFSGRAYATLPYRLS